MRGEGAKQRVAYCKGDGRFYLVLVWSTRVWLLPVPHVRKLASNLFWNNYKMFLSSKFSDFWGYWKRLFATSEEIYFNFKLRTWEKRKKWVQNLSFVAVVSQTDVKTGEIVSFEYCIDRFFELEISTWNKLFNRTVQSPHLTTFKNVNLILQGANLERDPSQKPRF